MSPRPNELSDRLHAGTGHADVISDVLQALRFTTLLFGRFELGAPWALRIMTKPTSSFYVVLRGRLRLAVEGEASPLLLSEGDVALVPRGAGHVLDDGSRCAPAPQDFIASEKLRAPSSGPVLADTQTFGGPGAACTLLVGCFRFAAGAEHPLLHTLPPAIYLPARDARVAAQLTATVQLMASESAAPGLGSALVLGRLADVLLVQAFRVRAALAGPQEVGLRALADPAVSAALALMHARWNESWTVESLAAQVGLSRSGFAARFHELVGETPLRYLVSWRMMKAALWLHETNDGLAEIAERVGYDSAPAFIKAFKQWRGIGPGAYRKARTTNPESGTSFMAGRKT